MTALELCNVKLLRIDELRILHDRANRDDRLLKIDFDPRGELQDRYMCEKQHINTIKRRVYAVNVVLYDQCMWCIGDACKRAVPANIV